MKSYTILLDGDLQVTPRLLAEIRKSNVIVADGAIRYVGPLGVTPELWVGDFDSADPALMVKYLII